MPAHQRAPELERILARRARGLVDEAFEVDAVLVRVDAAPRADRHVRVAHRVLDPQVRHGVAELRVAGLLVVALQLPVVAAVLGGGLVQERVDRLARHAHVQRDEVARVVDARRACRHCEIGR